VTDAAPHIIRALIATPLALYCLAAVIVGLCGVLQWVVPVGRGR
jgi:hypothetical protein